MNGIHDGRYLRGSTRGRSGAPLEFLVRGAASALRGTIVFAHPRGPEAKNFWLQHGHAEEFANRGYNVIVFDFSGFGDNQPTDGDYVGDLGAIAVAAREMFPDLRVFAVGAAFGAMRAIEAAAESPSLFDGVVAESVAPTVAGFWNGYPSPYVALRASHTIRPRPGRRSGFGKGGAAALPPLLLIHSNSDQRTPPVFGELLAGAIKRRRKERGRVERLVVDRAEHAHALRDAREAYTRKVFAFLDSVSSIDSSERHCQPPLASIAEGVSGRVALTLTKVSSAPSGAPAACGA